MLNWQQPVWESERHEWFKSPIIIPQPIRTASTLGFAMGDVLLMAMCIIFGQLWDGFVDYDDDQYFFNPLLRVGLA